MEIVNYARNLEILGQTVGIKICPGLNLGKNLGQKMVPLSEMAYD